MTCLPYLLASIVFHWDWITEKNDVNNYIHISKDHKIFNSRLVTSGIITRLKPQVLGINTSGRCQVTGVTATGIPPHVDLARQIKELEQENKRLRNCLNEQHIDVMEKLPEIVSTQVHDKIMNNFNIEGIQQLGRTEVNSMLQQWFEQVRSQILTPSIQPEQPINVSNSINSPLSQMDENGYAYWVWGAVFRPVPITYEYPKKITVKGIMDLFIGGIPVERIRPFRLFKLSTLPRKDQQYHSRAMHVFTAICKRFIDYMVTNGATMTYNDIYRMRLIDWDSAF
jgi:hypothetical protein